MQAFGMRFLRLGSGRSRTAAGVLGGTSIFNERAQIAPQERSYSI